MKPNWTCGVIAVGCFAMGVTLGEFAIKDKFEICMTQRVEFDPPGYSGNEELAYKCARHTGIWP